MRLTGSQVDELMKEEYYLSLSSGSTLLRGRVMLEQAGPSNLAGESLLLFLLLHWYQSQKQSSSSFD